MKKYIVLLVVITASVNAIANPGDGGGDTGSSSAFAKKLVCKQYHKNGDKVSGSQSVTLYTRLNEMNGKPELTDYELRKDEFNNEGGYNRVSISDGKYFYKQYSCDTEDTSVKFNLEDLKLSNLRANKMIVTGTWEYSVRDIEETFDIICKAY